MINKTIILLWQLCVLNAIFIKQSQPIDSGTFTKKITTYNDVPQRAENMDNIHTYEEKIIPDNHIETYTDKSSNMVDKLARKDFRIDRMKRDDDMQYRNIEEFYEDDEKSGTISDTLNRLDDADSKSTEERETNIVYDSEYSLEELTHQNNFDIGAKQKHEIYPQVKNEIKGKNAKESIKPPFPQIPVIQSYEDKDNTRHPTKQCLTGYMTDVQHWVDFYGNLTSNVASTYAIDASGKTNPVEILVKEIKLRRNLLGIIYVSMAKCALKRVPRVFTLSNRQGLPLYKTVEYLTLYGNEFSTANFAGVFFEEILNATGAETTKNNNKWPAISTWASGFQSITLDRLRELDLRKCGIQQLSGDIFRAMPSLEALYLGENQIMTISGGAFNGLRSLHHLDISRNLQNSNEREYISFESADVFKDLKNLTSLDLSFTLIRNKDAAIFSKINKNIFRLSICYSQLAYLPNSVFQGTELTLLDISGNIGLLTNWKVLEGLEDKLEVLYAKEMGLKTIDVFYKFEKLRVLNLTGNEISIMSKSVTRTLKSVRALNLGHNRLTTWYDSLFSEMPNLTLLSLRNNNINLISTQMIQDLHNVSYVGLSGNFIVCNCQTREMFEVAFRNQNKNTTVASPIVPHSKAIPYSFHRGYLDVKELIEKRNKVTRFCEKGAEVCEEENEIDTEGNFSFYDYDPTLYQCSSTAEDKSIPFSLVNSCNQSRKENSSLEVKLADGKKKLLFLLIIPAFILPILIFFYVFRRNMRYFLITMKNSATLSLIHNDKVIDDNTIFNYDVFVSYCNEDRNWVLDHLLPNVEKRNNVSVCLHERDFQVGLSILENIVSCMDRSRSILLVLSQHFLQSQWCQFEMHLAQHRLLETRREDLILVLLEDIPRRMRPTTLHYLMMTKTYIVWPTKTSEWPSFWRRLTRSLLARRQKDQSTNVSLA